MDENRISRLRFGPFNRFIDLWSRLASSRLWLACTLAAIALLCSLTFAPPKLRATSTCSSSSPTGTYTVTLCLDDPESGSSLSGLVPVNASVSVVGTNPGFSKLLFYVDEDGVLTENDYILTDYQSPYTFELPTTGWVDGVKTLAVEAITRDTPAQTTTPTDITVQFSNGITQVVTNTNMFTPSSGTTPGPDTAFVLAATGDGASGEVNAGKVVDLIESWNPNMFLYLGDVYDDGTKTEFHNWYGTGNSYFGRFRAITNPTVGNHEYRNGEAPGYFDFWGQRGDYFSTNAAGWHIIGLNSNSQEDQGPESAQYQWLQQDLNTNSAPCTIAFFHHPIYSVGMQGGQGGPTGRLNDFWNLFNNEGVDIVLTGHEHNYQRWYALDSNGNLSSNGVTQFIAGGGGHGIQGFDPTLLPEPRLALGIDETPDSLGALRMELNQHGAAFQYVNIDGELRDSGSVRCSGAPADTTPPNIQPVTLAGSSNSSASVNLTWAAATDNVGVTGYDIYRGGSLYASVGPGTNYTDTGVAPSATYQYKLKARDAAGNLSAFSNQVTVTTPATIFNDDFESGNMSQWTNFGLVVQQQHVFSGSYAARGTSSGASGTYARRVVSAVPSSLYYRIRFKVISKQAGHLLYLMKFRTESNSSIMGLYVSGSGKLSYRNDAGSTTVNSTMIVSQGQWHELQARVFINTANGNAGEVEVWYDGVRMAELSRTEVLGIRPAELLQLGENSSGRVYDVVFDQVTGSTSPISVPPTPTVTSTSTGTSTATSTSTSLPTFTATITATPTVTSTSTQTATATYTPTETATVTQTATATYTPTETATVTQTATATYTPTETATVTQTATATYTPTETATVTQTATATYTPTETATVTQTATATYTPTETATVTQTATATYTPTETATVTQTATATYTPTETATVTQTATATYTPTETATVTQTATATYTPTETATVTQTATATYTPTETATVTQTATATYTPTETATVTQTATATYTPTETATVTQTATATYTPTETATVTQTATATYTPTETATVTQTATATYTPTETATVTQTATATYTPTETATVTQTATATYTPTETATVTQTATATYTPTETATVTQTATATYTPTETATVTQTATATYTPTETATVTQTATATYTPTETATVTQTATATYTPTETATVTQTATATYTPTETATVTQTATATYTPTETATVTQTATATYTPTETATVTQTATATYTPTETATVTQTATATYTPTETATVTQTATATYTPTETATVTQTATATYTPTETATVTQTATATYTPTETATVTQTATATYTPTETATVTQTATATYTPTETATVTQTATATYTPTETATVTQTATATYTPTETATVTQTATATYTPTETATVTQTATATYTPTETATVTQTATATYTPTETATVTQTATATYTPTETATVTQTATATYTPTETATVTQTATATYTPTETATGTATATYTPTQTVTPSETPTQTATETVMLTPTYTATVTSTATETATSTYTPTQSPTPTVTITPTFTVTPTPTSQVLITDGFESGNMSQWTNFGLVVQQQHVFAGSYAARGTSSGTAAYARRDVSPTQTDIYYRIRFKVISKGSAPIHFMKFRTASNTPILGLFITGGDRLSYRNDAGNTTVNSSTTISHGVWHEVQLRARINVNNASAGEVEVWYDGVRVATLSRTDTLGTTPVGRVQLGEHSNGRTFDFAFDEIAVSNSFINASGGSQNHGGTPTAAVTATATATYIATGTATSVPTMVQTTMPSVTSTATSTGTAKVPPTYTAEPARTAVAEPTSTLASTPTSTGAPKSIATTPPTSSPTNLASATATTLPAVTATITPTASPTSTRAETKTFIAVADTYVSQAQPRTNYGADPTLRITSSSSKDNTRSYLQFKTEGLSTGGSAVRITRATLRLYTLDKSSGAEVEVHAVTDTAWKEMTLNYTNSPKVGALLGALEPSSIGWLSLDVTDHFASSESIGSSNLALVTSGNTVTYASRETGDKAPQLVIELSP